MLSALIHALGQKKATGDQLFPDLPDGAQGLPMLTDEPCLGGACGKCAAVCPSGALAVHGSTVELDRGLCVSCGACVAACPTGTIVHDRSTRTATVRREDLVLRQPSGVKTATAPSGATPFCKSIDVREVSTGCNATDQEVSAMTNPVFDCSRFGINFVASPRFADVLLVTGPVARAMQEPLVRCYDAMAEPRLVVAVGTCAVSGGVHRGGYANADGVVPHLPVAAFVPGCPPHPWSIIHGLLLAVGRNDL